MRNEKRRHQKRTARAARRTAAKASARRAARRAVREAAIDEPMTIVMTQEAIDLLGSLPPDEHQLSLEIGDPR